MRRDGIPAFTLIELLVVLSIIAMIMALATPAVTKILNQERIAAATDVLRSAVSRARSVAVSTRRSCTLDMSYTADEGMTERLTSSVMLVSDDFERYPDDVNHIDALKKTWACSPEPEIANTKNIWQIAVGNTHELWAGPNISKVGSSYAWHSESHSPSDPRIDTERTVTARFRMRRVNPEQQRGTWGFGLLVNFVRDQKQCVGYRFCIRAETDTRSGFNVISEAVLQKIYSPSNPNAENANDATGEGHTGIRLLDMPHQTALIAPNVWYRMKIDVKREDRIVKLAGKVWIDGSPEPVGMTVGPAYDGFAGAVFPADQSDSFKQAGDALSGGYCGVWGTGAEIACDDFAVDAHENWLLPGGIHLQPVRPPVGADIYSPTFTDDQLEPAPPYTPGGFPLSYRPDGTAAASQTVLIRITDIASGKQRYVLIDPDTGRVGAADDLSEVR